MKRTLRSRSQKRRPATRLGVQKLERRELMAADIGLADGFVAINGTAGNDVAEVYAESESIIVKVASYDASGEEIGATSETYQQSEVDGIVFEAGDGDDLFINDTNIDSITRSGGGNDTVMGGGGNDILAAGIGDDIVLGGGGDDIILSGPGDDVVIPARMDVQESELEPPGEDASIETAETPLTETDPADEAMDNTDPLVLEDETNVENEITNVAPATEEPMLDMETETAVIDGELAEPELLDIDDPITEETDVDEATAELSVVTDQQSSETDDASTCGADAATHDVAEETVLVQTSAEEIGDEAISLDGVSETATEVSNLGEAELPPIELTDAADSDDEDAEPNDEPEVFDTEDPIVSVDSDVEATDNDVIFGGTGDDVIFGEAGEDLIFGGNSAVDDALLRLVIAGRL